MVEMNPLVDLLEQKVKSCLRVAESYYQRPFDYQAIHINIRGRAAGQIRYEHSPLKNSLPLLRFNPYFLGRYQEVFIDEVVPHECAHLVAYAVYGMKIKPHGVEWKSIMKELYGCKPIVTHRYDMPKKALNTFEYRCACSDIKHQLSVIRHNKITRQTARYLCRSCGTALTHSN
jgi:SprT protein